MAQTNFDTHMQILEYMNDLIASILFTVTVWEQFNDIFLQFVNIRIRFYSVLLPYNYIFRERTYFESIFIFRGW